MASRGGGYEFVWHESDMHSHVKKATLHGLIALADIALAVMEENVPVETGYLKSTIFTDVEVGGSDGGTLIFGANAYYTVYVELGTVDHPAKPFIRPAADAVMTRCVEVMRAR